MDVFGKYIFRFSLPFLQEEYRIFRFLVDPQYSLFNERHHTI